MSSPGPAPDALLIGAPKAGTSALHAALAGHQQVFASRPKEPKYYLCGDAPPPAYCGPGDAHSQQEWVWRRRDYQRLFAGAPAGAVRIES
ncbi:MAG TPA: sulfotransferase, partial [Propionibacteriaceae bacterium]